MTAIRTGPKATRGFSSSLWISASRRASSIAAVDQTGSGCEEAAVDVVDDPLDYQWAYEGPDADEWAAGQTFVRCWAPD